MSDIVIRGPWMLQADHEVFRGKPRDDQGTVKGPCFFALHQLFERPCTEAASRVDELADRIAARGETPVATCSKSVGPARLGEDDSRTGAGEMPRRVRDDLGHLVSALEATAREREGHGDSTTSNLLDGKADAVEKRTRVIRAARG